VTTPGTNAIPTVDLGTWRSDPAAVAAQVDTALQRAGFLLVTGHGVDADLRAGVRAAARRFFALPDDVKRRYAVHIGGRGWLAPGVEANGLVEGTETLRRTSRSRSRPDRTRRPATPTWTRCGSRPTSGRTRCRNCVPS
jgi:isopenicillin N synthase-like dioxygenase